MYPPRKPVPARAAPTPTPAEEQATVHVTVRSRPLTHQERAKGAWTTVDVTDRRMINLMDPRDRTNTNDYLLRSRESTFAFDLALEEAASNQAVHELSTKGVTDHVLAGKAGTIFAYGATGSGKTYTMSGTGPDNPGVMFYVIDDLFRKIDDQKVTASYLEIYNERLSDLLNEDSNESIDLREDPRRGIIVSGLTEYPMQSPEDVFQILRKGERNRATGSHNLNERSSRSHAVLQISVDDAQLTMIDLAGSERAKKSGATKKMLGEAAKINRSLLALANCINALLKSSKGVYVPYRDSKLTRLLKDSLGGGAHTVMIATISSSSTQFDETRETLLYANRAKNIKVTPAMLKKRAQKAKQMFIEKGHGGSQYERIVTDMQKELKTLKRTLTTPAHRQQYERRQQGTSSRAAPSRRRSTKQQQPSIVVERVRTPPHEHFVRRIVSNFQDRIELRRSLVELEEMDGLNKLELSEMEDQGGDEAQALIDALHENGRHKQQQLEQLRELEVEGAVLRRAIQEHGELKGERLEIVDLTLDRCVLELQKTELEMRERVLEMRLQTRDDEIEYLKAMLSAAGIAYEPFKVQVREAPPPMPELPDLRLPNPEVAQLLATPKNPTRGVDSTVAFPFDQHLLLMSPAKSSQLQRLVHEYDGKPVGGPAGRQRRKSQQHQQQQHKKDVNRRHHRKKKVQPFRVFSFDEKQ